MVNVLVGGYKFTNDDQILTAIFFNSKVKSGGLQEQHSADPLQSPRDTSCKSKEAPGFYTPKSLRASKSQRREKVNEAELGHPTPPTFQLHAKKKNPKCKYLSIQKRGSEGNAVES